MSVTGIIIAAVIVGGTGLFIGVFLGVAGKKFAVEVDEREEAILGVLPGNNCGGCGYAGCSGLAAAIAKGEAPVGQCPVGGSTVAAQIGAIMGIEADTGTRMVAFVKCSGNTEASKADYAYTGLMDCTAMAYVPNGGPKSCNYGCLGYGSCVKACPFDAIHIVDGIAVVDKEACKACGKCVAACCYDARTLSFPEMHVDLEKCRFCGLCLDVCPTGALTGKRAAQTEEDLELERKSIEFYNSFN